MLRRRVLAPLAAAVILVAAACGGDGGYLYESNKSAGVYFKIPKDWAGFEKDLLNAVFLDPEKQASGDGLKLLETIYWHKAWDGSTSPDLSHFALGSANAPFAYVFVRRLLTDERGEISLDSLRNLTGIDVVALRESEREGFRKPSPDSLVNPDFETLADEELRPDGYRGIRQIFRVRNESGGLYTVAQVGFVDDETTRLIGFYIHCNAQCFTANEKQINDVIKSFTVKEA